MPLPILRPTPMQILVVREVAKGSNLVEAARILDVEWDTAKCHMKNMCRRIWAVDQAHAIYRIHERWPELVLDIKPSIETPPVLDASQHALLWRVSQGELIERAAGRLGLTKDAATGRLRKTYRQLEATGAPQAVHNGLILGVLDPLGEIR